MLEELSKKDKHWRSVALNICKDSMIADDIVQDMYIYFSERNQKVNEYYICLKIYGLFIDYIRAKDRRNEISIESFHYIEDTRKPFELDDSELKVLNNFNKLRWLEQELIIEHHINEKSLRQIQREYPMINYGYAYRTIKDAKDKLNGNT